MSLPQEPSNHTPPPPVFARAHRWARSQGWLRRFTLANRLLLAMAFLPTGLVKLMGHRFTVLPLESPVGFFFEAMYRTGPFWNFVGLVQVLAAVLLLIPRTATLGALMFLPVSIGVLLVTWGVGFGNTVYVAAGMLLSVTYLICWDGDRIWHGAAILLRRDPHAERLLEGATGPELAGWGLGGACGMGLFLITRDFLPAVLAPALLLIGAGAALLVVAGWVLGMPRSKREGKGARGSAPQAGNAVPTHVAHDEEPRGSGRVTRS